MKKQQKQTRVIEIRSAEGGEDARIFVAELALAYLKLCTRLGWSARPSEVVNVKSGHQTLAIDVEGQRLDRIDAEGGAQRLQRVPPTEKKGRVHSSTVTVAVLRPSASAGLGPWSKRSSSDFKMDWFNGTTKAGGQHHQKNATCCRLTHLPTGLVRTSQTRSRENSQKLAMEALLGDLDQMELGAHANAQNGIRKSQVGNGERAMEKRRTWRFQEDTVIDHETGKKALASKAMAGKIDLLW